MLYSNKQELIRGMENLMRQNNLGDLLGDCSKSEAGVPPAQYEPGIGNSQEPVIWTGSTEEFIPVTIGHETYQAMILSPTKLEFWHDMIRTERQKKKFRKQQRFEEIKANDPYDATCIDPENLTPENEDTACIAEAHYWIIQDMKRYVINLVAAQDTSFYQEIRNVEKLFVENNLATYEENNWLEIL